MSSRKSSAKNRSRSKSALTSRSTLTSLATDSVKNSKAKIPIELVMLQVAIYLLFLGYILHLENNNNCPCSVTNERLFLKYWLSFVLGVTILVFLFDRAGIKMPGFMASLLGIILLFGNLYYLYCVLVFVREMRNSECNCSDTLVRSVMEVFALVSVINILFSVLVISVAQFRK